MKTKSFLTRTAVAVPAAAIMIAAIPGLASAKSVKVKNGTYKGSILANSGDEGGDFRTPISISVKDRVVTRITLSKFTLWAATQPSGVSDGTAEPQSCQQAGTAPGSAYTPNITVQLSNGKAPGPFVKVTSKGTFSVTGSFGLLGEPDSAIQNVTYATTGNPPAVAGPTQFSFSGKFSSSKKAKGKLSTLSIALGAGIEKFTCNSYWTTGQTWPWGIPSASK